MMSINETMHVSVVNIVAAAAAAFSCAALPYAWLVKLNERQSVRARMLMCIYDQIID